MQQPIRSQNHLPIFKEVGEIEAGGIPNSSFVAHLRLPKIFVGLDQRQIAHREYGIDIHRRGKVGGRGIKA